MRKTHRGSEIAVEKIDSPAKKARILVVEDDAAVAKTFVQQLKRNGFDCEQATTAAKARQLLKQRDFDLILCDIMLPEENGIELIRQIRAEKSGIATIMVTGNDDRSVSRQALALGTCGLLLKPFSQHQLIVSVENALRISRASFKAIVERSMEAILVTDTEGTILFVNPAAARAFGKDAADLIGGFCGRIPVAGQSAEIDIARPGGEIGKGDMRVSETEWEGKPAFLVSIRDITERVKMETALKATADDLQWTVQELEAANQRIVEQQKSIIEQERLKVLLQIAGATAHELNQPLTSLLGRIELMAFHKDDPQKMQEDIRQISTAGSRIASIVRKIQTIRAEDAPGSPGNEAVINIDQDIHILSVEDRSVDYETIKSSLADFPNIHFYNCGRHADALDLLGRQPCDLVFLDYLLPDGTGPDFLHKMNRQGSPVPVVIITGQGDEMIASQMIQLGAYDYLPKHLVSRTSLLRVINNALEKSRLKREVRQAMQKMAEMSTRDELTGLFNRRYFEEALTTEIARAQRYQTALTLCMMDIDHFKKVNDTYGHPAGDTAMKELALLLQRNLRQTDIACRYGGEEFAVLLPNTDRGPALELCERFRDLLCRHTVIHADKTFQLTLSIGITAFSEADDARLSGLVDRADKALYMAKQKGRNRIVVY